ncbi:MAG: DUF2330 domain-containing protein [Acidimicrobiales bacterium]
MPKARAHNGRPPGPAAHHHRATRATHATRTATALAAGAVGVVALLLASATPAGACGGLVGENGTIQLVRTTTLAAYHDGIEHYVTAFQFTGEGESVGSIIPLPGVPTAVEKGGDWTLQRLAREVAPPVPTATEVALSAADEDVEVLLETQIDALDITVLRGGGDEVGRWAVDNGFLLSPDAPEVLDFYAARSPVFMAARFDADAAAARGQQEGDATPIHLTIPTDEPWVPLRILGLGLEPDRVVEADVFLLTDDRPELLAGGPGLELSRSEQASEFLLADLASDRGMEWIPSSMWLTHLPLAAPAGELDYDLAISTHAGTPPSVVDAGIAAPGDAPGLADLRQARSLDRPSSIWLAGGVVALVLGGFGVLAIAVTRRERRPIS